MLEQEIKNEIGTSSLNAPILNPAYIEMAIVDEQYYVFEGTTVTVCCLHLRNGYCVIGESATISPKNFNAVIGRKIARENAREKIWALEGYLLKERLMNS
jgi:hypothetical protein